MFQVVGIAGQLDSVVVGIFVEEEELGIVAGSVGVEPESTQSAGMRAEIGVEEVGIEEVGIEEKVAAAGAVVAGSAGVAG